ncbi:hypothetical protein HW115_16580 [Verrucomicrobiaceae bacterium N1E253]|uniref:Uncharacterized protein n=1 Tax=Oceaniferula marina TaxID=2748318 RepID=A0A851GR09_9BACT|nr:hypothetical protein [Oceaniferula marina]NWK57240.1 hypothetical protein [Oceaniferula marina]
MSSSAIYRIAVRGQLDAGLARHFDGLNLSEEKQSDLPPISILVGRFVDQAALTGLLHSLYELHLPLVSVECVLVEPT